MQEYCYKCMRPLNGYQFCGRCGCDNFAAELKLRGYKAKHDLDSNKDLIAAGIVKLISGGKNELPKLQ